MQDSVSAPFASASTEPITTWLARLGSYLVAGMFFCVLLAALSARAFGPAVAALLGTVLFTPQVRASRLFVAIAGHPTPRQFALGALVLLAIVLACAVMPQPCSAADEGKCSSDIPGDASLMLSMATVPNVIPPSA